MGVCNMATVIDWEYYNSHFPKLDEDTFKQYLYGAERFVLKKLPKAFEEYTESQQTDIKDCICNVLNYQSMTVGKQGLSSVSNDGYSESYRDSESSNINADLNAIVYDWISDLVSMYVGF